MKTIVTTAAAMLFIVACTKTETTGATTGQPKDQACWDQAMIELSDGHITNCDSLKLWQDEFWGCLTEEEQGGLQAQIDRQEFPFVPC